MLPTLAFVVPVVDFQYNLLQLIFTLIQLNLMGIYYWIENFMEGRDSKCYLKYHIKLWINLEILSLKQI